MQVKTIPPVAAAAAGAVCISSSAVLMKLASTASPSVTALGRCAFALPVLGALSMLERRRGATPMPSRSRWLARLAGVFLAAAGMIGALLLIQPAGSVALSYGFLGERPSVLQLAGVALVLAGVVVAVAGRTPEAAYSRRRTRIIRQAPTASTGRSPSKSP